MNTSQRTKIIAQGIALYAAYMDQPAIVHTDEQRKIESDWNDWRIENPMFVTFVQREQYRLFDQVNAAF